MEIRKILEKCMQLDLRITLDQKNLQIHSDKSPDPELVALIKANKSKIVEFLEKHNHSEKQSVPMREVDTEKGFALSFQQQSLHFIGELYDDHSQYNLCKVFSYQGYFDVKIANKTINLLLARHPMLSTRFDSFDGDITQYFTAPQSVEILEKRETIEDVWQYEQTFQFDLSGESLIRVIHVIKGVDSGWVLFNLPHRVVDGKSVSIITKEFVGIYQALISGIEPQLPVLKNRYSDFVAWQSSDNQLKKHQKELGFWRDRLANSPPLHMLQTDNARPAVKSTKGDTFTTELSAKINVKIDDFCKLNAVTPFIFLQTIMAVLVSRYSGVEEVVIGTPVECRSHEQLENVVGLFANSVAVKSCIDSDVSFSKQLEDNKQRIIEAMSNQDVPLRKVVEDLNPERAMSHSPLFQLFFSLDTGSIDPIALDGVTLTPAVFDDKTSKFDLELMIQRGNCGAFIHWYYDPKLFNHQSIESIAFSYEKILSAVLENVDIQCDGISLADIPILSTEPIYSKRLIHELIESHAITNANNIAITDVNGQIDYKTLNEQSNKVAHFLLSNGVCVGEFVGVSLDRSIDAVIAIVGILKSGAAYVPIDPIMPQDRRKYITEDAGISKVITNLEETFWQALSLNSILKNSGESVNPEIEIQPDSLAYAIYTSGSTGKPKGVMVTHDNATSLLAACSRHYELNSSSRITNFHSISFDFSVWEVFSALTNGSTLYVVPEPLKLDIKQLVDYVIDNEITLLSLTPSVFYLVSNELVVQHRTPKLQYIVLGGEALERQKIDHWFDSQYSEHISLINMYGITETTVHVTYEEVTASSNDSSIGIPLVGYEVFVVNRLGKLQPINAIGELWVAGTGVAKGYLNRAELTEERFSVVDINGVKKRVYKTGDLASINPDGSLRYIGRADQQIKLRGYRIELGEIEVAIHSLENVSAAVVDKVACTPGEQLVAFVIVETLPHVDWQQKITEQLKGLLPSYMIPSIIQVVNEIPVTSNGKVDRKRLANTIVYESDVNKLALVTRTEHELAEIWCDLLQLKEVFASDNFFMLGGHSLLIAKLVSLINKHFNKQLTLTLVYENPELNQLATVIENSDLQCDCIPLRSNRTEYLPTSAQNSMWLACQIDQNSSKYNIPMTLKLQGQLNATAVLNSLYQVVERHESLRTKFINIGGQLVGQVNNTVSVQHELIDLSQIDLQEQEQMVAEHQRLEGEVGFDLEHGLLLRSKLIKIDTNTHYLLITVHHLACDAWSIDNLFNEFSIIYKALSQGTKPDLLSLDIQYGDYANWNNESLSKLSTESCLEFWQEQLKGAPLIHNLPIDYARPVIASNKASVETHTFGPEVYKCLQLIAKEKQCSVFNVVQPLFAFLLAQLSNETDIMMVCPQAGRSNSQLENIIGLFTQNLIFRTKFTPEVSFSELIANSHNWFVNSTNHQSIAYDDIVKSIVPIRQYGFSPLCQIALNFLTNVKTQEQLFELEWQDVSKEYGIQDIDLHLTIRDTGESLDIRWLYNNALFKTETVNAWIEQFKTLAELLVNNVDTPIANLPSTAWSRYDVLNNSPSLSKLPSTYVHEVVEEKAVLFPNNTAVVDETNELSYIELNEAANQYARYLVDKGLEKGQNVGICIDRNVNFVVAMLAVLKAGAAYVPLTPDRPDNYLEEIASDAGVEFVLTEQSLMQKFDFLAYKRMVPMDQNFRKVLLSKFSTSNLELNLALPEQQCAYVIYTSGSTGKPKGVQVYHRALNNLLCHDHAMLQLDQTSKMLNCFSFGFDPASGVVFSALTAGAAIHICPTYQQLDLYIEKHQLTHLGFPTALASATPVKHWPHVSVVFVGGESCSMALAQDWGKHYKFFNLYGPTEATIYALYDEYKKDQEITIGKPISNSKCFILNKFGQLADVGQVGELVIAGASVGTRYIEEALNDKSYMQVNTPHGFERAYCTGDLALLNEAGKVEYKGRKDSQIKIRGYRIEPKEIEAQLLALNVIKEAAIVIYSPDTIESSLVAYFTHIENSTPFPDFTLLLADKLPQWMIPSKFIAVEELPLSVNGKLDIEQLPEPELVVIEMVKPKTTLEKEVISLWCEALTIENISMLDDFFNIGGNSLVAMVLVNQINNKYTLEINVKNIFENATPVKFVEFLLSEGVNENNAEQVVEMEW